MIRFAKLHEAAKIPSKEKWNAGYDVYACFPEPFRVLPAHTTTMIPTSICSAIPNEYYAQMFNRGSNGCKGLLQACGVIDASYRGEWFVAITNTNDDDWYIIKQEFREDDSKFQTFPYMYPYEKAICQFVLLPVPVEEIIEVEPEVIQLDKTNRGSGSMGSSGK